MQDETQVRIEVLKAAAGRSKTGELLKIASLDLYRTRTIFAVRSIATGKSIEHRLNDQFKVDKKMFRRIDSDSCQPGMVLRDLDFAVNDPDLRIIICTQEALVRYTKWDEHGHEFTLNLDELPNAVEFSMCAFTHDSAKSLVDAYGLCSTGIEHDDAESLSESINKDQSIFQKCAKKMLKDDESNPDYKTWDGDVRKVLSASPETPSLYIHSTVVKKKDSTKVVITVVTKSRIFETLKHFNKITLTTMLLEDHEFELIGKASGITFTDFKWEHQNKPFENSENITLVVMTDIDGSASKNQFLKTDDEGEQLFVRAIKQLTSLEFFQESNAIPSSKNRQIMLYTNERYQKQIRSLKLDSRFEFLPYNTHGLPNWEGENLFASFLTYRWIPTFNIIGKRFAKDHKLEFEKLVDAYNFTHMFEPICQSMTRGIIRKHEESKDFKTWIGVPDLWTAQQLKRRLFPEASIDTNHMVSTKSNNVDKPIGRPPTWRGTAKEYICTNDKDAQWINRNINTIENYFGKEMDNTNPIDICLTIKYLNQFQSERTPYKTNILEEY